MPRYAERKVLPYAPQDVFDLVADIGKYPEFLPWCLAARVTKREGDVVYADLVIGWKMIRETFTSKVTLNRPTEIRSDYVEGPMRTLTNLWRFAPTSQGHCVVDLAVEFEFKSKSLQAVMGTVFDQISRRMVSAFEARAKAILRPVA